ncbi:hypothetical protein AB0A05_25435 [Streptomyces sp. NPDC046374]|uniref:hypothetical protein n=1 Tax=Streptomyces sp. NPDC046374 TaxID=3154917 RepID=UPI0033DDF23F
MSQAEGRRWSTLEGTAVIKDDPATVADVERRYTERYKTPRVNPNRVVIEVTVTRALGPRTRTTTTSTAGDVWRT